jgi:hypothetical protein
MISKLLRKKKIQENSQIMFQICVLDQKVERKKLMLHLNFFFLNAMIRNIKICNIFYIIEILINSHFRFPLIFERF